MASHGRGKGSGAMHFRRNVYIGFEDEGGDTEAKATYVDQQLPRLDAVESSVCL